MKRLKLIQHLNEHNCYLAREGGSHSIFENAIDGCITAVPRHADIDEITAMKICKQLGIPKIK